VKYFAISDESDEAAAANDQKPRVGVFVEEKEEGVRLGVGE